jgi:hypothetical protein
MDEIFGAVDLATVTAFVIATGILIIGITMAFVGISLAKKAINLVDSDYQIKQEDRYTDWHKEDWDNNYAEGYELERARFNKDNQ